MGLTHSPRIATDGLALCLDAGNVRSYPGSGTSWNNLAGTNSFYLYNGISYNDNNAGYLTFDGVNDYAMSSALGDISNGISISGWIYMNNAGDGILMDGRSNAGTYAYAINISSSKIYYQTYLATQYISPTLTFSSGKWYFITCTQTGVSSDGDSATLSVYVNGNFIGSDSRNSPALLTSFMRIGRKNAAYHNGNIAMVVCNKKTLSANEIKQNYLATKGRFNL
jgi:hypothetical protein